MTLIENAIKYTRNKKIKDAVDITLEVQGNRLQFYCRNFYEDEKVPQNGNGLGLNLIRQRLELLYKDKYEIRNGLQDQWYVVELKINLNDH
jgi:LytS/YehU family sensor histidine kinase